MRERKLYEESTYTATLAADVGAGPVHQHVLTKGGGVSEHLTTPTIGACLVDRRIYIYI